MNTKENTIYPRVKHWIDVTDPYNYKLESDKEQIAKEVMKVVINTAREAWHASGMKTVSFQGYDKDYENKCFEKFLESKGIKE